MNEDFSSMLNNWAKNDRCNLTLPELKAIHGIYSNIAKRYKEKYGLENWDEEGIWYSFLGELHSQLDSIGYLIPICSFFPPYYYKIAKQTQEEVKNNLRNIFLIYYPIYEHNYRTKAKRSSILTDPNEALKHAFGKFISQGRDEDTEYILKRLGALISLDKERELIQEVKEVSNRVFYKRRKVHYRKKEEFESWVPRLIGTLFKYCNESPERNIAKRLQNCSPREAYKELEREFKGADVGQKVISFYLRDLYDLNILNTKKLEISPSANSLEWSYLIPIDIHVKRVVFIPGARFYHVSGLSIKSGFFTEYDKEVAELLLQTRDLDKTIKLHGEFDYFKYLFAGFSLQAKLDPTKVEKGIWVMGKIYSSRFSELINRIIG